MENIATQRVNYSRNARKWSIMILLLCLIPAIVLMSRQTAHQAHAAGGLPATWWQHLTGEKTINVRSDGSTLNYVTSQLATYQADGYHILNIDWPVQSGPTNLYGGFSAADYLHVDPSIGTDQDWVNLLNAAHSRSIAVISWFNPSYFWTGAAVFKQAEADVKTYGPNRANQPANSPARWFEWRGSTGAATKPCDSCGGSFKSSRWVTDPDAGGNVSYYGVWSDQPSGDYAAPEWQNQIKTYLNHWLDTGIDGFIFDAPQDYVNCDANCDKAYVIAPVHAYSNRMAASEAPRDATAISTWGFDATTDQTFWGNEAGTTAISNHNPSGLEAALATRDGIVGAGGTDYSAPDFTKTADAATHLLQAATIAASGNYLVIWDPGAGFGTLNAWAGEGASFAKITNAVVNNPALQSQGARQHVATNNDNNFYAFVRTSPDGTQKALVVLNYQASQQNITVSLSGINGGTTDLLNGGSGPTISNNSLSVTLPAYGYGFYGIATSGSSVTVDDTAAGWTWNNFPQYSDSSAYGGTAHGGQGATGSGQYTFTGTGVQVFGWKGDGGGAIQVLLDNVSQGTFSEAGTGDTYNQQLFSIAGLTNGSHTVKIIGASNSGWNMVDDIVYTRSAATTTTIDDTAAGWTWSNYPQYGDSSCYGGTAHGGQDAIGSGSYTFNGTGVQVFAWKGDGGGSIQIVVDGVSQGTFSENGTGDTYNQQLFSVTNLSSGNHTVKVVGQTGGWNMIDYIRVIS